MLHSFLAIFQVLQFSWHIPSPNVSISHFPCFPDFSPYFNSYSVYFPFFKFFSVSRHIQGHTVFVSNFPIFFSFHAIIQVLQCTFLIFHVFLCFLTYSRSYSDLFSFSNFFSVSRHIQGHRVFVSNFPIFSVFTPGHTVYISHFLRFSLFLNMFQVLQWAFLIFHVFSVFSPNSRSYSMHYSFSTIFIHLFSFLFPSPSFQYLPRYSSLILTFPRVQDPWKGLYA